MVGSKKYIRDLLVFEGFVNLILRDRETSCGRGGRNVANLPQNLQSFVGRGSAGRTGVMTYGDDAPLFLSYEMKIDAGPDALLVVVWAPETANLPEESHHGESKV